MGGVMSSIPGVGMLSTTTITNRIFHNFEHVKDFEGFHETLLEVFTKLNAVMPGVHYDVPPRKDVQKCYDDWGKNKGVEDRKKLLKELLEKSQPRKGDNSMLVTGVIAPPVAMIGKRTAEGMPTLNKIKVIPDVVFVPTATLLALTVAKLYRTNTVNVDKSATKTTSDPGKASV